MRLTTILCQLTDTFAGFLPTVRYLPAVALVSYLIDRSHSWYPAYLKIFVLVQGTYTPQVIRHDWRTNTSQQSPQSYCQMLMGRQKVLDFEIAKMRQGALLGGC